MRLLLPSLLCAAGCFIDADARDRALDRDRDGYVAWQVGGEDCDDSNPTIHPGAVESCLDELDSDCDGQPCWERAEVFLEDQEPWREGSSEAARLSLGPAPRDYDGDGVLELVLYEERGADGDGRVQSWPLPQPLDALRAEPAGRLVGRTGTSEGLRAGTPGDLDGDGDAEIVVASVEGGTAFLLDALPASRPDASPPRILVSGHSTEDPPEELHTRLVFGQVQELGTWDDGRAAFLLGAPALGAGGVKRGAVFLFTGIPVEEGVVEAEDVARATLTGIEDDDCFGNSLNGAADLDGDGRLDPLVLAPGYRPMVAGSEGRSGATGGAFGFTGPLSGMVSADSADLLLTSYYNNALLGAPGGAGDIDGDGYDDVGAYYGAGVGQFAVFLGPLEGEFRPEQADLRLLGDAGETETYGFGARWTPAGDLDDDGFDDLVIAAPDEGTGGLGDGPVLSGAHYLFLGPLTGVLSPDHARIRWTGAIEDGRQSGAVVGDIDQDGALDLLLGSPPGAGAIHLVPDAFGGLPR